MIRRKNFTAAAPSVSRSEINLLTDELTLHTDFVQDGRRLVKGIAAVQENSYGGVPQNSVYAHYSAEKKHFALMDGQAIYFCKRNGAFIRKPVSFGDNTFAVEDYYNGVRALIYFCGGERFVFDGESYIKPTPHYDFFCGVMHCGRLFAIHRYDRYRLYWSAGDATVWPWNIDGAGYIDLDVQGGEVIALREYKEKLVVIRTNGFTIVDAYGEPQHFTVRATENYMTSDEIIRESIAICGGRIYFFTASGMRWFDGSSVGKPDNPADSKYENPTIAAGLGDRYYFKCRLTATDEYVICVYDCGSGSSSFVYLNASCFAVGDAVYPIVGASILKLTGKSEAVAQWHSREVDFGTGNLKCLTEIYADCDADAEITVRSELGTVVLHGAGRHRPRISGRSFSFSVTSAHGVNSLKAVTEEVV